MRGRMEKRMMVIKEDFRPRIWATTAATRNFNEFQQQQREEEDLHG